MNLEIYFYFSSFTAGSFNIYIARPFISSVDLKSSEKKIIIVVRNIFKENLAFPYMTDIRFLGPLFQPFVFDLKYLELIIV